MYQSKYALLIRFWRIFFAYTDGWLLFFVICLSSIGLTALYSATHNYYDYQFLDQIRNFMLMLLIALTIARLPLGILLKGSPPIYLAGVLLLILVMIVGTELLGAKRWLNLGFTRIQPSEMMKIALPMMLAWYFHFRQQKLMLIDYCISGTLLLLPFMLIVIQPDLGTAILIFSSGFFVIFFAGLSIRLVTIASLIVAITVPVLIYNTSSLCDPETDWVVLKNYQKKRVCTLLDPESDPRGSSYHIRQSTIAVGSGGVYGKGYMNGTQTHLKFIPERSTDFIFAVFSEEFGLVGNVSLLMLYLGIIFRGLIISARSPIIFTKLLGSALSMTIFIYVMVNIGMVTGIFPVVGIPLPFISYGGTSLITMGMIIGILLAINRYTKEFIYYQSAK